MSVQDEDSDARLFHDLGAQFAAEDPAPPVADAASARVVESLLVTLQKRPRRRRSIWLLAAASLFAASLAGAVIGVQRLRSSKGLSTAASAGASASGSRAAIPIAPSAAPATVPSQAPPAAAPSSELPTARQEAASAAELFSAAGRARRTGQSAQASTLLETLIKRYPASAEASAARITLGELQLERGAPAAALGNFDAYLQRSPRGALAPEALWGRARAQTRLGNTAEANRSLSELLQRYPSSPYASAARAKLGASTPKP
jgi:TolA-binding protein